MEPERTPSIKETDHHLKSQLTMSPRIFENWRPCALEAEPKPVDIDSVPEFLRQICQNPVLTGDEKKDRSWSASAMSLSFVLYAISAKAYRFLKSRLALPSVSVISERIGPIIHSREHNLLSRDAIGSAVQQWRLQWDVSRGRGR
jgi:hypothetical protein